MYFDLDMITIIDMSNRFEQWAMLSGSDKTPEPGDLVMVSPLGDMTGYVLCGAVYVGSRRVDVVGDGVVFGGRPPLIHEVLYNGAVLTISGHSHEVQVLITGDD